MSNAKKATECTYCAKPSKWKFVRAGGAVIYLCEDDAKKVRKQQLAGTMPGSMRPILGVAQPQTSKPQPMTVLKAPESPRVYHPNCEKLPPLTPEIRAAAMERAAREREALMKNSYGPSGSYR